jgi:hypothetical protein
VLRLGLHSFYSQVFSNTTGTPSPKRNTHSKFTKHNPYWHTNGSSRDSIILLGPNFQYHIHKRMPPASILSQINLLHALPANLRSTLTRTIPPIPHLGASNSILGRACRGGPTALLWKSPHLKKKLLDLSWGGHIKRTRRATAWYSGRTTGYGTDGS